MSASGKAVVAGAVVGSGVGAYRAYQRRVRPWCLHWGASEDEARQLLSGDEIVAEPAGARN